VTENSATDDQRALTQGIHPLWWATAIERWLGNEFVSLYYSGRVRDSAPGFLHFDSEPEEGLRLLAITRATLVGVVIQPAGNPPTLSISRTAISLRELLRLDTNWSAWINPMDLDNVDLQPQGSFTAKIELRSPLSGFGARIALPLAATDYGGQPKLAVQRFMDQLERQLSYISSLEEGL
jgi:hypothetical protein